MKKYSLIFYISVILLIGFSCSTAAKLTYARQKQTLDFLKRCREGETVRIVTMGSLSIAELAKSKQKAGAETFQLIYHNSDSEKGDKYYLRFWNCK